jgi:putative transposase
MYEPKSERYLEAPYRDISRPPISLWELRDAKRQLREESKTATNEELIFKTIDRMRALVDSEAAKTKSARAKQQRRKQWNAAPKVSLNKAAVKLPDKSLRPTVEIEEDFAPFVGIRES